MNLPRIGQPAPTFQGKAVLNDKVFDISSSDYANKHLILLFFPMDFTYVCPTGLLVVSGQTIELIAFSDQLKDLQELETDIVACSVESPFCHLKWLSIPHREGGIRGLRIPLIADKSMAIARKFGVLDEEEGIAYRALFIIDNKGILRQITINDRHVGRCVPETLRLLRAIQQAERLREITPKSSFLEVMPSSIEKPRLSHGSERNLLLDLTE